MPPVLYPALPDIAFSKNPIWLKISSDDFLIDLPATAVNYLEFTGAIAEDHVITFSWTGGATVMTAKDAPNNSGTQFPTGTGESVYVALILEYFKGNYFLDKYYDLTINNSGAHPRIIFTAKSKGPELNFTAIGNVGVTTVGVSDTPKPNFRHHVQLWMADPFSSEFNQVYSANVPLDHPSAGETTIDIHEALHAYLTSDNPELFAGVAKCENSIRKCYVKYAQFYGTDPVVMRVYQSDPFIVTKGGLSKEASADRNIYGELCPVPEEPGTWHLLRQGSKNKLVRTDQPEWLTYLNLTGASKVATLEITIYNADETDFTFTPAAAVVDAGEKWQFRTGYTELDIAGSQAFGKRPIYYTARIKGPAGYLSAAYAYVIDYNFEEWPRMFVYENAYGAFQTVCTTGKGQSEFDRTKDDARYAVDQRTAAISGEFLETNVYIQDKYTVNYGYGRASARNLALLRDFFASRKRFIYQAGKLIPIGISTKNAKDAPDGTNVYASSFEYYPLNINDVFTEDPAQADDQIDELLTDAGSAPTPLPPAEPGTLEGYNLVVPFGDPRLSFVDYSPEDEPGTLIYLRYTNATWLAEKSGYPIYTSQRSRYFYPDEIEYNYAGGFFTILSPGFALEFGDQLIVWPFLLVNP